MNTKNGIILLAAISTLGSVNIGLAEEVGTLETMTVTANKTEENVQEVANSLSVFSGDQVNDLKMENVLDISTYTPNFTLFENGVTGANTPSMRGMMADLHTHAVTVGLYVDGVPFLDGMGYDQALVDVERIEVLRGPQGTLYGKGSETGVINVITKAPDNEVRVPLSVEVGTDNKYKGTATASGPIVKDKVYGSLTYLHDQEDGWVEDTNGDTVDDIQQDYVAGKLRVTPTDDLDFTYTGTFLKYNNGESHMNLTEQGAAAFGLSAPEDRVVGSSSDGYDDTETFSHALQAEYLVTPTMQLTSTTAYRKIQYDALRDYDFSEYEYMDFYNNNEMMRLSEELRLGSVDSPVKWVVGVFADTDELKEDYYSDSVIPAMVMSVDDAVMDGTSGSVFTNVNVPIGDFSIIGGIRYDYQERTFEQPSYGISLEEDWEEVSPKAGVEYRVTESTMTYATVAKGYLSGGFNAYADDPDYASYDEEKLWSYEVGVKNTLLGNKLIINAALFYMDISDALVQETIDAARSYTTNAAEVTSQGFELEAVYMPITGLTLNAGFGYTDAEFDDFSDADGDYSGNKKPYASDYTFNIGGNYRTAFGMYCGVNVTGNGDMYTDKNNLYKRDAFALVDAKIGYEAENYDVYLYGKNVFDEEYDSYYSDGTYVIYSEPAEYGIMLSYRF